MSRWLRLSLIIGLLASPRLARAEEGMWLFDDFPADAVKQAYGATIDAKWLERVRLGSLRLANGCSASLVGADGLVMTNHHCVRACLEDLSTKERDVLANGWVAARREDELACPKIELNQLVSITDVTAGVLAATKGAQGAEYTAKLKAESARLESECAKGDPKRRCDVVTLFQGARFHLYAYRRLRDARLVFAPELQAATFGGDPDNFSFPRYAFDVAFLRVYDEGKPLATPEHLRFAAKGAKDGDLVFVSGHPGGTERSQTIAQLELQRDVVLPWQIMHLAEQRGRLEEWMKLSPERARIARSPLRGLDNSVKALRGRRDALVAPGFLASKAAEEAALRAKAPEATKGAWDTIAKAADVDRGLWRDYQLLEGTMGFQSELFRYARLLLRRAAEAGKPNAERLREYGDAQWPQSEQLLLAAAPVHRELEEATLTWSLTRLRAELGPDHPLVTLVLGPKSPEELAHELVMGSKLDDPAVRKALLAKGAALGDDDPMIALAKKVDPAARAIRKRREDEVDAPMKKSAELVAEARRAVQGTTGYPDATFTLRLSYGKVAGTSTAKPMTYVDGLWARATGRPPFDLVPRWQAAKAKLDPKVPFNLTTTNDIIGGNSGSPLVDRHGDVVGLVFDGNLASLGGRYGYDGRDNRTVAVHGDLILAALRHVYGAGHLVAELTAK